MNMDNPQPNPNSDALSGGTPLGVLRKVDRLRAKIKARSAELGIVPDHDSTGHWYKFEGQRLKSVTYHLAILKDPGLMNWKMNRALEYVGENIKYSPNFKPNYWLEIKTIADFIEAAKQVPVTEFEGAGSIGKQVHDWRQEWFEALIEDKETAIPRDQFGQFDGAVISGCRGLMKFMKDTHYIPLATELYVADGKLGIGGTLDDIGLLPRFKDGNLTVFDLVLIDLKTSNIGDKEAYYAQVCLYLAMFKKLYKLHPKGSYILHLSKENGTYDLIPLHERCDIKKTTKWAKDVVKVSQGLDELKAGKKIKPRII